MMLFEHSRLKSHAGHYALGSDSVPQIHVVQIGIGGKSCDFSQLFVASHTEEEKADLCEMGEIIIGRLSAAV